MPVDRVEDIDAGVRIKMKALISLLMRVDGNVIIPLLSYVHRDDYN